DLGPSGNDPGRDHVAQVKLVPIEVQRHFLVGGDSSPVKKSSVHASQVTEKNLGALDADPQVLVADGEGSDPDRRLGPTTEDDLVLGDAKRLLLGSLPESDDVAVLLFGLHDNPWLRLLGGLVHLRL